ncbi:MAG: FAD-binding oxidoreductase, partial [Gammaproteobacteria bacterium]|nr:FAD-binding oxidoreductase [Gammaproteobacteria bacterium]
AGTALAWHLMQAGERVCVVDDGHRTASSVVAAGLLNPLAGLRFNRRPDTTDCLDAADRWYAALAGQFGRDFHHPMPMLRLFRSEEQRRFHARRRRDPASRALLDEALPPEHLPEPIAAPFGAFVQHRTGYVDLPGLLEALRAWLDGQGALAGLAVDPSAIRPTDDRVEVAGL